MKENDSTIDIDINDIDVQDTNNSDNGTSVDENTNVASVDEEIDEDEIVIENKDAPVIMLFGPRSSGKSMTLVRLSRYLRANGYTIVIDDCFKSDAKYKDKCEEFQNYLSTKEALPGNAYTDFLLVKIVKQRRTICQILEAPGEHYFDPKNIAASNFPPYMTRIIRSLPNRKIWAFITEAKWKVNHSMKSAYVQRICNCKNVLMKGTDRTIILYNMIDKREELFEEGKIYVESAEKAMRQEYNGLADVFRNTNPITRLWRPHNYKFVPFCTGFYFKEGNRLKYEDSENIYPRLLWEALTKCIRG